MRKDMKDVIIDVVRRGGSDQSQYSRAYIRDADPEDLPTRIPTGRHRLYGYDAKEPTDRLSPLRGFLEKNVGRPWDDVWHEICEHADNRNLRGFHLRTHVKREVEPNPDEVHPWSDSLYVDWDGILRLSRARTRAERRRRWGNFKPLTRFSTTDPNFYYEKIDGFWYSFQTTHVKEGYALQDLVMVDGEVQIVSRPGPEFYRHVVTKQQVDGGTQAWLDGEVDRIESEWLENNI
jgi:hypothetical protein